MKKISILLLIFLCYLPSCKNSEEKNVHTNMETTDMVAEDTVWTGTLDPVGGYEFADKGWIASEDFIYTPSWIFSHGEWAPDFGYGPGVYPPEDED